MTSEIPVSQLTEAALTGNGVFDVLMRATKAHLDEEYVKNRIRGPEYSQVYLGSLTQILQTAAQFLLEKQKADLEAQLLGKQIELAEIQKDKALAEVELVRNQTLNTIAEREAIQLQAGKILAEVALLGAQKALSEAQVLNLAEEKLQIVAKTSQITQETRNLAVQETILGKQALALDATTAKTKQETTNLVTAELIAKVQRDLVSQQVTNAITENENMLKQGCKLQAEYDVLMEQKLKTVAEATLLNQKNMTEKAQTVALGVDDNSVIGKQKKLYEAQTQGFSRDAEQKAAKLLVDSWNVRRTTDEGTVADGTNMLNDATVGRAVMKMLQGVGA